MPAISKVGKYLGLNFHQVLDLDCDTYLYALGAALTDEMMQTEEGQQRLDDWRRYQITEPDMDAVHRLMREG